MIMLNGLDHLLQVNSEDRQYFFSLPKYAQQAAAEHAAEIDSSNALHLFVETFMEDDSYRGS